MFILIVISLVKHIGSTRALSCHVIYVKVANSGKFWKNLESVAQKLAEILHNYRIFGGHFLLEM